MVNHPTIAEIFGDEPSSEDDPVNSDDPVVLRQMIKRLRHALALANSRLERCSQRASWDSWKIDQQREEIRAGWERTRRGDEFS